MWGKIDEDGCGGEKERKTEAEVDGQCKCDSRGKGLSGEEMQKRAVWRQLVRNTNPDVEVGKDGTEEEDVVFCPGFQKGRVPSEKGTLAR